MRTFNSYFTAIAFTFLLCFRIHAQDLPQMEWNKIANDDLKMTLWATDSTADAAILGDIGHVEMTEVRDNLGFNLTRHKRIKIFNKSAFDRANIRIVYRAKDDFEYILKVKAQTILPNGKRIPVESKSFIIEKLDDKVSVQKFTFPNVVEGAILEYEYVFASQNLFELKAWEFQHDIPTRFSFIHLNVEARFSYTYLYQGKSFIKDTKVVQDQSGSAVTTSEVRTRFGFYCENLPALKKEAFVSTTDNYLVKINFQLSEYYDQSGAKRNVIPSWEKTVKELLDDKDFGDNYLKKSKYEDVWEKVKPLIQPTDSAMQKINTIYDWVNENIEWDDDLWYYATKSPNDVYKKRKGNSADLNFMLIGLLREAGVEANPVILSTRENGKTFLDFPFLRQYNHTIAHVELNGKMLLLDCGDLNRPPGMIRTDALNGKGYLVKKKDSKWIDIEPQTSTQISVANVTMSEDGALKGSIGFQFKGIAGAEKRKETDRDESGNTLKAALSKKYPDWHVDSVLLKNLKNSREPLQENLYLKINNVGQVNDDFIYVKPTLQSGWEKNPFKLPTRFYPVEFPYPINEQYVLNLKIPKGYKIEEMPKPVNYSFPPDDAKFQYLIGAQGDNVNLVVRVVIKKTLFAIENYEFLKKFFDDIASKLDEQIVLKKVGKE
jgi:Transglutaminase-like superfamily/Domain of Unknown Function with PDB structure (DUF3857)